jgi:predicted ArsR family transcriptional regulator
MRRNHRKPLDCRRASSLLNHSSKTPNVNIYFDFIDMAGVRAYPGKQCKEAPVPESQWESRFFASTRGQVITLLRRGGRTVDDLALALELTDNAVRSHLTALERDGLVRQSGVRRGGGKPAYTYELTAAAERLFPKADAPLLRLLLDVLDERLPAATFAEVLRAVGQRAAAGTAGSGGDFGSRVDRAVALLGELGGLAEWSERDGVVEIRGCSCPLAAAMPGHPAVSRLAAALLTEVVGSPVCDRCDLGEPSRCRFEVAPAPPMPAA